MARIGKHTPELLGRALSPSSLRREGKGWVCEQAHSASRAARLRLSSAPRTQAPTGARPQPGCQTPFWAAPSLEFLGHSVKKTDRQTDRRDRKHQGSGLPVGGRAPCRDGTGICFSLWVKVKKRSSRRAPVESAWDQAWDQAAALLPAGRAPARPQPLCPERHGIASRPGVRGHEPPPKAWPSLLQALSLQRGLSEPTAGGQRWGPPGSAGRASRRQGRGGPALAPWGATTLSLRSQTCPQDCDT